MSDQAGRETTVSASNSATNSGRDTTHEECHAWATDAYDHGYADGLAEQIRALAEGADERRKTPGVPDDLTALAGREATAEECPCPPMFRDVAYCPDCPVKAGRETTHDDDCHRREGGTYCDCKSGREATAEECPCPPMFRDVAYCPDCPVKAGREASRSFHEVYVWWCGVQGQEPYAEDSPYYNPDGDGNYVDAYAIWTEFCHD